jgi:hypothetical protein
MLDCKGVPGAPRPLTAQERYVLDVMEDTLREDPVLRRRYGKSRIRTCADARRFVGIYRALGRDP